MEGFPIILVSCLGTKGTQLLGNPVDTSCGRANFRDGEPKN